MSKKDKIELSNQHGIPITTVGQLREILQPFTDNCPITPLHVFYIPMEEDNSAELEVELSTNNSQCMENGWCPPPGS